MNRALVVFVCALSVAAFAADTAAVVDELHRHRDDLKAVEQEETLLKDGLKANPSDYGLNWRMARLRWWQADGTSGDQKKDLGKEGWEYGEKAIAANPNGAEGQYFTRICIGAYSQGAGILKALSEGLEGKFNEHVDRSMKDAPDLERGGPAVAKGRYWFELPWPKRSLDKSATLLKKVLEKHPENLRAKLYLAQTQLKDGDAKAAKQSVSEVLSADPSYDPPDAKRIQERAKDFQKQVDKELE